ncbi:CGNR zinc finger domain-containing protein [Mycolicibacterium arabiense]|nr:CGNR zinc finger domain-containing protein [Mycolicibacterium arabiense]
MNTLRADRHAIRDELTSPAALRDWLVRMTGEAFAAPRPAELVAARRLRDSLRLVAAVSTGDPRGDSTWPTDEVENALSVVNETASWRARTNLVLRAGRVLGDVVFHTSPVSAALGDVAHEAVEFFAGPAAQTLRPCCAPRCVLYFVKTHPRREWCSQTCGNRVRAARHYQRIRPQV